MSQGLACPWGTYPPTAPGDPEEGGGGGRCLSDLVPLFKGVHSPGLSQAACHQFLALDARMSYDSFWGCQLLGVPAPDVILRTHTCHQVGLGGEACGNTVGTRDSTSSVSTL